MPVLDRSNSFPRSNEQVILDYISLCCKLQLLHSLQLLRGSPRVFEKERCHG